IPSFRLRVGRVDGAQGRRVQGHRRAEGRGRWLEIAVGHVIEAKVTLLLAAPAPGATPLSEVSADEVLDVGWVNGPVVSLAVFTATSLQGRLTEVVPHAVAPTLALVLVERVVFLYPVVDGAQIQAPLV
ncbi:hypothetical protein EGW08_004870, partial [Elysia chlorotica]